MEDQESRGERFASFRDPNLITNKIPASRQTGFRQRLLLEYFWKKAWRGSPSAGILGSARGPPSTARMNLTRHPGGLSTWT